MTTQQEFAAYLLQLEYPNQDAHDAAAVLAARLRYIEVGHDAMEAGLVLMDRRAK